LIEKTVKRVDLRYKPFKQVSNIRARQINPTAIRQAQVSDQQIRPVASQPGARRLYIS
jgi:hypothetical protein